MMQRGVGRRVRALCVASDDDRAAFPLSAGCQRSSPPPMYAWLTRLLLLADDVMQLEALGALAGRARPRAASLLPLLARPSRSVTRRRPRFPGFAHVRRMLRRFRINRTKLQTASVPEHTHGNATAAGV
jgi:hypothetical protein